jgi:hypothetical protein
MKVNRLVGRCGQGLERKQLANFDMESDLSDCRNLDVREHHGAMFAHALASPFPLNQAAILLPLLCDDLHSRV